MARWLLVLCVGAICLLNVFGREGGGSIGGTVGGTSGNFSWSFGVGGIKSGGGIETGTTGGGSSGNGTGGESTGVETDGGTIYEVVGGKCSVGETGDAGGETEANSYRQVIYKESLIAIVNKPAKVAVILNYSSRLFIVLNGQQSSIDVVDIAEQVRYYLKNEAKKHKLIWSNFEDYFQKLSSLRDYLKHGQENGEKSKLVDLDKEVRGDLDQVVTFLGSTSSISEVRSLIIKFIDKLKGSLSLLYKGSGSFEILIGVDGFLRVNIALAEVLDYSTGKLDQNTLPFNVTTISQAGSAAEILLKVLSQVGERFDLIKVFAGLFSSQEKVLGLLENACGGSDSDIDALIMILLNYAELVNGKGSIDILISSVLNYNFQSDNGQNLYSLVNETLAVVANQDRLFHNAGGFSIYVSVLSSITVNTHTGNNITISDIIPLLISGSSKNPLGIFVNVMSSFCQALNIPDSFEPILKQFNQTLDAGSTTGDSDLQVIYKSYLIAIFKNSSKTAVIIDYRSRIIVEFNGKQASIQVIDLIKNVRYIFKNDIEDRIWSNFEGYFLKLSSLQFLVKEGQEIGTKSSIDGTVGGEVDEVFTTLGASLPLSEVVSLSLNFTKQLKGRLSWVYKGSGSFSISGGVQIFINSNLAVTEFISNSKGEGTTTGTDNETTEAGSTGSESGQGTTEGVTGAGGTGSTGVGGQETTPGTDNETTEAGSTGSESGQGSTEGETGGGGTGSTGVSGQETTPGTHNQTTEAGSTGSESGQGSTEGGTGGVSTGFTGVSGQETTPGTDNETTEAGSTGNEPGEGSTEGGTGGGSTGFTGVSGEETTPGTESETTEAGSSGNEPGNSERLVLYKSSLYAVINKSARMGQIIDYSSRIIVELNGKRGNIIVVDISKQMRYFLKNGADIQNSIWANFEGYFQKLSSLQSILETCKTKGVAAKVGTTEEQVAEPLEEIFNSLGGSSTLAEELSLLLKFTDLLKGTLSFVYKGSGSFKIISGVDGFIRVNIAVAELLNYTTGHLDLKSLNFDVKQISEARSGAEILLKVLSEAGARVDLIKVFAGLFSSQEKVLSLLKEACGGFDSDVDALIMILLNYAELVIKKGSIDLLIGSVLNYESRSEDGQQLYNLVNQTLTLLSNQDRLFHNSRGFSIYVSVLSSIISNKQSANKINLSYIFTLLISGSSMNPLGYFVNVMSTFYQALNIQDSFGPIKKQYSQSLNGGSTTDLLVIYKPSLICVVNNPAKMAIIFDYSSLLIAEFNGKQSTIHVLETTKHLRYHLKNNGDLGNIWSDFEAYFQKQSSLEGLLQIGQQKGVKTDSGNLEPVRGELQELAQGLGISLPLQEILPLLTKFVNLDSFLSLVYKGSGSLRIAGGLELFVKVHLAVAKVLSYPEKGGAGGGEKECESGGRGNVGFGVHWEVGHGRGKGRGHFHIGIGSTGGNGGEDENKKKNCRPVGIRWEIFGGRGHRGRGNWGHRYFHIGRDKNWGEGWRKHWGEGEGGSKFGHGGGRNHEGGNHWGGGKGGSEIGHGGGRNHEGGNHEGGNHWGGGKGGSNFGHGGGRNHEGNWGGSVGAEGGHGHGGFHIGAGAGK